MDKSLVDKAVKSLTASATAYPATGSLASLVFYVKVQVQVTNGKTFDGHEYGVSSPGGGALFGDVYTSDINALYSNTDSFMVVSTPAYVSVIFFDKHHTTLGNFQSGAVSTVSGTGGGKGSWS